MRCVIYLRVSTREQAEKSEGEEGFSIPAKREACTRHIRDAGWLLADEYVDRGESARSADRPALKAMLDRIAEDRDVDAVVVHKIDRLARNMEDHVAIRALLRRRGVALVSVTENVDETASGRLVEGIHALMVEFYSANLANEIKKGLTQKAKQGGFPHGAPLGYVNLREVVGGRQVARIVPDPERGPLIAAAFEHYATGDWTLQRLAGELAHQGLTNRGQRGSHRPRSPGRASPRSLPTRSTSASWNGTAFNTPAPTSRSSPPTSFAGSKSSSLPARRGGPANARTPLPEGHAALRGVRPAALHPALQRPLHLLLLPRPEERPGRHLPGALRRRQ